MDVDGDDGMGDTIVDDRDDNLCVCDPVACPLEMNADAVPFECVVVDTGFFMDLCLAPCNADADGAAAVVGDFTEGICAEGTACLASGLPAADPPTLAAGAPHCFPTDILCRAENGVLLNTCDEAFSCVGESLIEGVETSPFCAPLCAMDIAYCADYPCPEGFVS